MLLTIAIILAILWAIGFSIHVAGSIIHLVLVVALIMVVIHFLRGSRPV